MRNALALLRLLRPHQWAKNLLVVVPILTGHRWMDRQAWICTGIIAAALCAMASALYVLNDMLDVAADRLHPTKRHRPIAAGRVEVPAAGMVLVSLAAIAISVASTVSVRAVMLVLAYAAGSACYSLWFKRVAVGDIIMLALLYVFRIVAGGVAAGIHVSDWLLTFAFFLFLSLAAGKRMSEFILLAPHRVEGESGRLAARGYDSQDMAFVQTFGIAAAVGSIIILCLYLQSDVVHKLYRTPRLLWLAIPLFTGWIARLWRKVIRGQVDSDPVLHVLRDPASYATGLVLALLAILAQPQPS